MNSSEAFNNSTAYFNHLWNIFPYRKIIIERCSLRDIENMMSEPGRYEQVLKVHNLCIEIYNQQFRANLPEQENKKSLFDSDIKPIQNDHAVKSNRQNSNILKNEKLADRIVQSEQEAHKLLETKPVGSFYIWPFYILPFKTNEEKPDFFSNNATYSIKIPGEKGNEIIKSFHLKDRASCERFEKIVSCFDTLRHDIVQTFLIYEAQGRLIERKQDQTARFTVNEFDYKIFVEDIISAMTDISKRQNPKNMGCLLKLGRFDICKTGIHFANFQSLKNLNESFLNEEFKKKQLKFWLRNTVISSRNEVETTLQRAGKYQFKVWPSQTVSGSFSYAVRMPWGLIDLRRIETNENPIFTIRAGTLVVEQDRLQTHQPRKMKNEKDRQLILNLGSGNTARGLIGKAKKMHLTSHYIDLRTQDLNDFSKDQKNYFAQLSHDSRLYIIGHCAAGEDYIISDEGVAITAEQFADIIAQNCPQLKRVNYEKEITISVIACSAGAYGPSKEKPFCHQLCQKLDEKGINSKVYGRASSVSRWNGQEEGYEKRVDGWHHRNGDKLIFFPYQKIVCKATYTYSEDKNIPINLDPNLIDLDTELKDHFLNVADFASEEDINKYLKEYSNRNYNQASWIIRQAQNGSIIIYSFDGQLFDHYVVNIDVFYRSGKTFCLRDLFKDEDFKDFCLKNNLDTLGELTNNKTFRNNEILKKNALFVHASQLTKLEFTEESKYVYPQ